MHLVEEVTAGIGNARAGAAQGGERRGKPWRNIIDRIFGGAPAETHARLGWYVLVDRHLPACVVVGVRDEVDVCGGSGGWMDGWVQGAAGPWVSARRRGRSENSAEAQR